MHSQMRKQTPIAGATFKVCGQCKTRKASALFFATSHSSDGLSRACKACAFANARADRAVREARAEAFKAQRAGGPAA